MDRRHRRTLEAVSAQPVSGTIRWDEVEALLGALGALVEERAGSRVAVLLNDRVAVFHRPHPRPEMDKAAVRDLRRFLHNAGVTA
ncbi:MAG: type II toxin-antitoxin system HicA family toxin [Candidatus Latescibacterota bacterium]